MRPAPGIIIKNDVSIGFGNAKLLFCAQSWSSRPLNKPCHLLKVWFMVAKKSSRCTVVGGQTQRHVGAMAKGHAATARRRL